MTSWLLVNSPKFHWAVGRFWHEADLWFRCKRQQFICRVQAVQRFAEKRLKTYF